MSKHYLIDALTTPLASSRITDVRSDVTISPMDGDFVVKIADELALSQEPTDLPNLLTLKHLAQMALYPGYPLVTYDDLLDSTGISAITGGSTGDRSTIYLNPGGTITTVVSILPGPAPTECFVTWEEAFVNVSDRKDALLTRSYVETFGGLTCQVSFNGGATFLVAVDGAMLNIPLVDQGNNLQLRFTNPTPNKILLGSWAVIS